jgi:hypothetical protein
VITNVTLSSCIAPFLTENLWPAACLPGKAVTASLTSVPRARHTMGYGSPRCTGGRYNLLVVSAWPSFCNLFEDGEYSLTTKAGFTEAGSSSRQCLLHTMDYRHTIQRLLPVSIRAAIQLLLPGPFRTRIQPESNVSESQIIVSRDNPAEQSLEVLYTEGTSLPSSEKDSQGQAGY